MSVLWRNEIYRVRFLLFNIMYNKVNCSCQYLHFDKIILGFFVANQRGSLNQNYRRKKRNWAKNRCFSKLAKTSTVDKKKKCFQNFLYNDRRTVFSCFFFLLHGKPSSFVLESHKALGMQSQHSKITTLPMLPFDQSPGKFCCRGVGGRGSSW